MTHAARPTTPRFDSPEQEVFLNLWRTYDKLKALEDEYFAGYGLTPQQYNLLRLLRAAAPEPVTTLRLASRLVSRAPDITRMLDRLEERGLIRRDRPADDRRVVRVSLTDDGRTLLARMAGPLRACHARQLGHLSAGQLSDLARLLRAARAPHENPESPWSHAT